MNQELKPCLKYVLIEGTDDGDQIISIFNTLAERASATRIAILGPDDTESQCPELLTLSTEGRVDFECDPSLHWIDAYLGDVSAIENTRAALWQEFDTAPRSDHKNKQYFLAIDAKGRMAVGWKCDWRFTSGHAIGQPTHWQPLPAPPLAERKPTP